MPTSEDEAIRETQKLHEKLDRLARHDTEKYIRLLQIAIGNLKATLEGVIEEHEESKHG